MNLEDAGLGDVLVLDCRVFHRAGVDGTHHVEKGVEFVLMDDPADGPFAAVLTVEQEQALDPSIAGYLHDLLLDLENLERHPMVAEVCEVRRG